MAASKYVDASHNVLYTLEPDEWREDLDKSGVADVVGYQEANLRSARRAIRDWCVENNRALYAPMKSDLPISWKKDVFTQVRFDGKPVQGTREVHQSALQMGITAPLNPARDFSFVGLQHRQTTKKILRINVHPLAGGTKPEDNPDNDDSDALSVYKDWGIAQYWLDIVSFVSRQMSVQEPLPDTMKSFWDIITIGGDFNAEMSNNSRWYYPGSLLPALFVQDKQLHGLDHLEHTHGSDVKAGKRWVISGNTDHRIHFQERTILNVFDFPRER